MKSICKLLFILLPVLTSFHCFSQRFFFTETEIKSADRQPNYIGAELPADKKYYFKTGDGLDSVLLSSYSIYGHGFKRTVILDPEKWIEGAKLCDFIKPPYFKGTLSEGNMQEGELYFEVPYYSTIHLYKGSFVNKRANGLGIYTITSKQIGISPIECKAFFENGNISNRGLLKLDYDSTGIPTLYYSGDIKLIDGNSIIMDGVGSFYRTDYVKPHHNFYKPILNKEYGMGVSNAYYEGQVINNIRTGFCLYNSYNYDTKKTSNLKVGLIAADYPVNQFSELPVNANIPDKVAIKNDGLYRLFPQFSEATGASFIYNGRKYAGMQYNKKPYGFGIMTDTDGFYEIGFWKNGTRINTLELLKNLLPDSALLTPQIVENKVTRITQKYNSKKNKYFDEKETITENIIYYGKLNSEGKIEGWGFRYGGFRTEVGYFLPSKLENNKKADMPEAVTVFKTCYAINYGNGAGSGYGVQWAKNRFFTSSGFYAEQTVPSGGIPLINRDVNTIALSEYRDKRNYEVVGWEKYTANVIAENKIKEIEKQKAFDGMFLKVANPSSAEIRNCVGNFYLDRSGSYLYKVLRVETGNNFQVGKYATHSFYSSHVYLSAKDLLSSGNYRQVQRYIICRSCGGNGTVSSSYSYTADYEYTYGAKIKTTYNKTSLCSCGCGLEPEQFGAKRDW